MAGTDLRQVVDRLVGLSREISQGNYDRAQEMFDLTAGQSHDPLIQELAESFGMMIVQVEGREFRLEQLIEELQETNQQLERTLRKVKLLENIKAHLGKFVPEQVKSLIDANPEAPDLEKRQKDVTILFLDIAGYTRMSEQVSQAEMNYLIERYFSAFLDDIHTNQGDINETAGDGLMIIFQDDDRAVHALNAARTAVSIQSKVVEINARESDRHQAVAVNIGINSGLCSVGSTRFEGVSGTRWTYTASGSATNMAARLGALAKNGQIFIGEETNNRVVESFPTADAGQHELKNVSQPVQVYELKTG